MSKLGMKMDRRGVVRLLALAPIALSLKPKEHPPQVVPCQMCSRSVFEVHWPMSVHAHGTAFCDNHNGGIVIMNFVFGKHPEASQLEFDYLMAQESARVMPRVRALRQRLQVSPV